jgi:hypothetical protein
MSKVKKNICGNLGCLMFIDWTWKKKTLFVENHNDIDASPLAKISFIKY